MEQRVKHVKKFIYTKPYKKLLRYKIRSIHFLVYIKFQFFFLQTMISKRQKSWQYMFGIKEFVSYRLQLTFLGMVSRYIYSYWTFYNHIIELHLIFLIEAQAELGTPYKRKLVLPRINAIDYHFQMRTLSDCGVDGHYSPDYFEENMNWPSWCKCSNCSES